MGMIVVVLDGAATNNRILGRANGRIAVFRMKLRYGKRIGVFLPNRETVFANSPCN